MLTCSVGVKLRLISGNNGCVFLAQRNVASYLQTLCLVESFRTSFDDLLSLAAVFNSDIRRALLTLQAQLAISSTFCHKVAAAVYGSAASSVSTSVGNDAKSPGKSPQPKGGVVICIPPADSGDEFKVVRPRKCRLLRVASSDDDNQSLSDAPSDPVPAASCVGSSERSATSVASTPELCPVVLDSQVAPPVHHLDFASIGGLKSLPRQSRINLQVGNFAAGFFYTLVTGAVAVLPVGSVSTAMPPLILRFVFAFFTDSQPYVWFLNIF